MNDHLIFTIDKFSFNIPRDCLYSREGLWVRIDSEGVWVGLTDFLQGRSGDVAFAEVQPQGTNLALGDELAVIETIKVDTILPAPLSGKILQLNPALEDGPEVINLDPYGEGWLACLDPSNWEGERSHLIDPQSYFNLIKRLAEEEIGQYG